MSSSKPFDSRTDNNRRSDTSVRSAIDAIQNLLFDPQASAKIFPLMLEHISTITNSDYGVILTANADGVMPITADAKQQLHCTHCKQNIAFVRTKTVCQWIEQKIMPMRPVFFNDPIPKSYTVLLLNPEQISSIIILPIVSQNHMDIRLPLTIASFQANFGTSI
ncbi:MAG: hypothetical protein AAFZ92_09035 [Pseudomonadota bacterium]